MKRVLFLVMMTVLSGFVFAASSGTAVEFSVDDPQEVNMEDHESSEGFVDDFEYPISIFIVLLIAYLVFRKKIFKKTKKKK